MSFPNRPKDGEVYQHPNGYDYEYDYSNNTWEKIPETTQLPRYEERQIRKRPARLNEAKPTVDVTVSE